MDIGIKNNTKGRIDSYLIRRAAGEFFSYFGKNKERDSAVSIVFVGERVIRRLNRTYRGADKVTDVLAFDDEGDFLGEIIICYSRIKRQAPKYGHSVKQELIFILIHGLLHLIGYDDKTEKGRREMERLGEKIVSKISNLPVIPAQAGIQK